MRELIDFNERLRLALVNWVNSVDWLHVLSTTWNAIWVVVPDLAQIFILYLVIYSILKAAKGSRFGQVLMGAGVLVTALAFFTLIFHFDVLQKILSGLLLYLALSTVVIFQQEIRRFLETLGTLLKEDNRRSLNAARNAVTPEAVVECVFCLAGRKMGALLAFERGISLKGYEMTGGVVLDARLSTELLISIFTPPLPLHDGGVIIRNGRVSAAHCTFPTSTNPIELSSSGMRHRAAVGITEETDAFVLVVSEERGQVSIASNGKLTRYPDLSEKTRRAILKRLNDAISIQKSPREVLEAKLDLHGFWSNKLAHFVRRPTEQKTRTSSK